MIPFKEFNAQNYSYKHITTKDGLPSSTITGITKDKNGVIWIATEKGLCYISNSKIQQFKGLPDEGVLSVFASADGSLWVGYGEKSFLVRIKNGEIKSFSKEKSASKNGSVLGFYEHNKHIYLAQNDGITVISPDGKFKPLTNKIVSDTMMSYWTVDFFTHNKKVYATSVLRGVNEVVIRDKDVVFKNVYTGDFLYSSFCSDNNLILTFDPESKLFDAAKFLSKQNQKPIKTLSSRRPASFVKDITKTIFGGCYNMNFGYHGLIKFDRNFNEELILPEVVFGQELLYDDANNEIYFGTAFGLYKINASLYSRTFQTIPVLTENSIISSFPISKGVVALTDEGLVQLNEKNEIIKKVSIKEMLNVAMQVKSDDLKYFRDYIFENWKTKTFNGLQLDDLKFVNNKWIVFTRIGFFIINKQFNIEDFVPVIATNFKFSNNGEMLFDQDHIGFIALKSGLKKTVLFDSFRKDKFTLKRLKGIEIFGNKTILVSMNQGVFLYDNKSLQKIKLEKSGFAVYKSTSFKNKYLVITSVNGEIKFYDSENNFKLVKILEKSNFNNESILDIKGDENFLVFITAKRVFIWDGKKLRSYNEYQNKKENFQHINISENQLVIFASNTIIRLELLGLLNQIDKKTVFNVTNQFTKNKEPLFNTTNIFLAKNKTLFLQFLTYNELENDVLKSYYKLADNEWIEIEPSGKIYLQNLDFGNTKIEFKVNDLRTGKTTWQHSYTVAYPAPWYLQRLTLFIYFLLFSGSIVLITRYFVIKSKKKEIEKLTLVNKLNNLQMEALQSQMNPHFVFNALNSVQKFILDIDQEKALLFLNQFSVLIRKVLDFSNLKSITIEEELEFIDLYFKIENQRFQEALQLIKEIDCDDETMIPPLLIQPLIENAIIYGARSESGKMKIFLQIKQEANFLKIEIKNELNPQVIKNHAFQSRSSEIIQKRLALFDNTASLKTTVENQFFIASILLPINE